MRIACDRPWLGVDLGAPHRVLSWAVHRPGLVSAQRILWREVRDADLTPGDPRDTLIHRAFNAHQRRVVGDRRLLGRYGAPIARGLFGLAGWRVQTRTTNWQLDAEHTDVEPSA